MKKAETRNFSFVINSFLGSPKFAGLAHNTQVSYRRYLLLAEKPTTLGAIPVEQMRPSIIQAFLDAIANPGSRQCALVALSAVESWAVVRDLLIHPITLGVKVDRTGSGHKPWTDAQVACALEHARPDIARVVMLAANTGQRGSDLVRMTWADIERVDGRLGVNVTTQKVGLQIWVPFTSELEAAIATWERGPRPLLVKEDGTPWAGRHQMSEAWNRERDRNPDLASCAGMVLHGLRATAVVRLRRLGARPTQIADMIGLSIPMIERYCRFASQKENASAAVVYLDRARTENEHKLRKSDQKG